MGESSGDHKLELAGSETANNTLDCSAPLQQEGF